MSYDKQKALESLLILNAVEVINYRFENRDGMIQRVNSNRELIVKFDLLSLIDELWLNKFVSMSDEELKRISLKDALINISFVSFVDIANMLPAEQIDVLYSVATLSNEFGEFLEGKKNPEITQLIEDAGQFILDTPEMR